MQAGGCNYMHVTVYTDGAFEGKTPGPGGLSGAVLLYTDPSGWAAYKRVQPGL